ncbi:MAG: Spy/CpxP family protein refolding chaperone [Pirellulaceae bacterium]|jgi:Spy/CpxP family protein refolding chaperone
MLRQTKPLLIILSVALNIAFVGVWLAYAAAPRMQWQGTSCEPGNRETVWCPLHRELNCTPAQWEKIEPRLRDFRVAADAIGQEIGLRRLRIIDLLTSQQPDLSAVKNTQDEILAGQRKMQTLVVEQLTFEKSILTLSQQEQLFDMLRSRSGGNRGALLVPGGGHEGGIGQVLRTGGE